MKKTLLILPAALLLTGCFKSRIESPAQKTIILAGQNDKCEELDSRKVFALFGLGAVPFNNQSSIPSLQNISDKEKVRFTTKISFLDYVISWVTMGIVGAHTITTEVCR